MIERYTRERMAQVWTDQNKYHKWLDIEVLICEAYTQLNVIPSEDMKNIKEKARFDVQRVLEIEERTRHDVVAFIENVAEYVGPSSKYIHMGVTSSDILDTSFACLLVEAADILIEDIRALMEILKEKAYATKGMPAIGRTHGIHAEPVTFGLKVTHFYDEMRRNLERMIAAKERVRYGKISGAVGTYAHVPPFVEEYVCEKLKLKVTPISSQIIPRDNYAEFFTTLALVGSTIEKMSMEVRNLQRTEVGEAEEFFRKGQTGSSAMPHKRNPIASENLCGMARLLHGYAMSSLENIPLWHERDISHSSVERVIAPDATIVLDYSLERVKNVFKNLIVYPDKMQKNLDITKGLYHSEAILIALIRKGLTRQDAYKVTQAVAMRCYEGGLDFVTELKKDDPLRQYLSEKEIDETCTNDHYFRHVDTIFKRVYG
ncbi:MAG: adenylosuccinate lyase [Syntrophorhabdaceae bacterium]|nr:adenylosuccinate lyase [Syntrophorhabdaceae bacterium]MDD4196029.1 adenylosuccinate lyase [Syntrophorhabdaceae bacterium]HOC45951.1 adenylosuccinate lyase [Syntrophorhabdaceae bacterium]